MNTASKAPRTARPLDHAVLPTADLDIARTRLGRLGFTVAPVGLHPFGTKNACVFFADGTFLEPLAVASRETCEATARKGNTFTARDRAFRFRCGEDGFSAFAMGTDDAAADHAAFVEAGFSAGPQVAFSRVLVTLNGAQAEAAFSLAFAGDLRAPDALFFTCERVASPKIDRGALVGHENGAIGIAEVVLCEPNPSDFQYLVEDVVNQRDIHSDSFGIRAQAANGAVSVLTPAGMSTHFGTGGLQGSGSKERGLRFRALILKTTSLKSVTGCLERAGIGWQRVLGRIVVAPAPGQGAILAFEEPQ